MQVRDAMTRQVATVAPTTSALAALRMMSGRRIRHLPVVDSDELVGIVSDRDLTPAIRTPPSADLRARTVGRLMSSPVQSVRPDDDLLAATRQLLAWRISALPVVDHGRVVGILTTTDCLEAMVSAIGDATSSAG